MTRKLMTLGALTGLLVAVAGAGAYADTVASNDSDQIIVRITPNVDRGVEIDTSAVVLNLGAVDLFASTQTVTPATVTILGNIGNQELDLSGAIASAGTAWTFDASASTDATSGTLDQLAAYALFSATTRPTAPTGTDFADGTAAASVTGGAQRVGGPSGNGSKHELQGGDTVNMDNKSPGDTAHMWMFFRLPSSTTGSDEQAVTLTLTAAAGS